MTSARALLSSAIPYGIVVATLLESPLALPFAALAWVIALVAADEPGLVSTVGRHSDVGNFQRTDLGHALTFRRGWVPGRVRPWVWPLGALLLFGPGLGLAWHAVAGPPMGVAEIRAYAGHLLLSPAAVLALGFFAEMLLVQPLVAPFIALGTMLGLVTTVGRHPDLFSRILGGLGVFAGLLYAVDLVRLVRRERE